MPKYGATIREQVPYNDVSTVSTEHVLFQEEQVISVIVPSLFIQLNIFGIDSFFWASIIQVETTQ